jgi:hypothetical protein
MIAAVTLKFLNPFGTGKLVLFQVTYDKVCHAISGCSFAHILQRTGMHMNSYFSSYLAF